MLELKNLFFEVTTEGSKKTIIDDISTTIEKGSFVVITGPNGSGKSTLAKLIMGIDMPSQGQILFEEEDITSMNVADRAKKGISFAFQQPVKLKGLTVHDMLSFAANRDLSVEEACTYLVEVGLCAADYVMRELDSTLSGGELKRIEIAMVLARGTKLAIFDEPEAGIDLWGFHNLIKVFENIRKKKDRNIIIISHQERILKLADRIIVIEEGKIAKEGSVDEILPSILETADTLCDFYKEAQ